MGRKVTYATKPTTPAAETLNAQLVLRVVEPSDPSQLARIDTGHFDLVPAGEGRTYTRIVFRDRKTGELSLEVYGPGHEDNPEIAYLEMGLHHPASSGRKEPFKWIKPPSHLHFIGYGLDRLGLKDNFINIQHGGSVNVVWTLVEGRIFVARVKQKRSTRITLQNPDGWTWSLSRGNLDPKATVLRLISKKDEPDTARDAAIDTANEELEQEIGKFQANEPVKLTGEVIKTQDSSWFRGYYRDGANGAVMLGGIEAIAREVPSGLIEPDPENEGNYRFKIGQLGPRAEDTAKGLPEFIGKSSFAPLKAVLQGVDLFDTLAGLLIPYLEDQGRLTMTVK